DATSVSIHKNSIPQLSTLVQSVSEKDLDDDIERFLTATTPGSLATIIYTSGTTGEPKGVMLTHGNLASNAISISLELEENIDGNFERRMNMLPLSHIFARTCDSFEWIVGASELTLADSPQTALDELQIYQPTVLNAVPYFYNKAMQTLIDRGQTEVPGALRALLGGRMQWCCSGGAPLPVHTSRFFAERDLLLVQGYGLTESSPVITINSRKLYKHGTIGKPLMGVEVRIADDGEVLSRGPHIMQGYWNRPEETASALQDGWLHTGDLGEIDEEGFVKITGRKKELIVTTGGKKIVPSAVEHLLIEDPLIHQAFLVGEGRNYLTALIVPDRQALVETLAANGVTCTLDGVCQNADAEQVIMDRVRQRTVNLSPYEQVKKVALIDREFSVEREELTLTMKPRRKIIASHFESVIERLYTSEK
ncbi:MAG: AMP-binding protein, partial [Planctomycetes bacterium]|nr:AMP-binding protein [Planctomycetota bacterium]